MKSRMRRQATIKESVSVKGFGFWSGEDAQVTFGPAEADRGIVFVRSDLPNQPQIPATLNWRTPGPRRTTLQQADVSVELVEHVLAALSGLQIDNCLIYLDRSEVPGLDGSAEPFVQALQMAGRREQVAWRKQLVILEPLRVESSDGWIEACPGLPTQLKLKYMLDYGSHPAIGKQNFEFRFDRRRFVDEVASARTFLLEQEALALQSKGLGCRVRYEDVLVFNEQGPVQNGLRFENECARHKLLDMIGDFALSGCDIVGSVTAYRSGHQLNAEFVSALLKQYHLTTQRVSA